MNEKNKITRRDALKRIGKIAAAASLASVVPIDIFAGESKAEERTPVVAYNSFYSSYNSYRSYRSYSSYNSYNSYRSYYSYNSYYSYYSYRSYLGCF